jgi:hypothetical protein
MLKKSRVDGKWPDGKTEPLCYLNFFIKELNWLHENQPGRVLSAGGPSIVRSFDRSLGICVGARICGLVHAQIPSLYRIPLEPFVLGSRCVLCGHQRVNHLAAPVQTSRRKEATLSLRSDIQPAKSCQQHR